MLTHNRRRNAHRIKAAIRRHGFARPDWIDDAIPPQIRRLWAALALMADDEGHIAASDDAIREACQLDVPTFQICMFVVQMMRAAYRGEDGSLWLSNGEF